MGPPPHVFPFEGTVLGTMDAGVPETGMLLSQVLLQQLRQNIVNPIGL